jgi:aromatic-L-amino-acid/L-tryptophan decarboxylase
MLDDILDYIEHIRERPVWQPIPDHVRAHFCQAAPTAPTDLATVHDEFMRTILPYATGNTHPAFMGWVHGGGNVAGMLAEMLAAGLNANLGGRDHVPIAVEYQIVQWVRHFFGFPETASGLFVTGTSMANLLGVLIARTAALGAGVRRRGVTAGHPQLTAYTSAAAHGCVVRAMEIAGLGSEALRLIPTNSRQQIDLGELERTIAADRRAGFSPFLIVGTAGTVDTGAIDGLADLACIAQQEKIWLHVDGAYGALAILAPDIAPRLAGIERADSIAFDFHKWGQVPYDAGFLLVRDGTIHRDTFASPAAYLRRETRGLAAGSLWPCDLGPDLSRGFRALKTWFTLKVHGTAAIGAAISRTCALARYLESIVATTPKLELLAPVELNIVCFRYRGKDANRLNATIVADLHESGIAAPSITMIGDQLAVRAAIVNHRTDKRDVDALVNAVVSFGDRHIRSCAA